MSIALPASMGLTDILSLAIAAILVNNYILVQFLGCCSFFGVSKKTDTALGRSLRSDDGDELSRLLLVLRRIQED